MSNSPEQPMEQSQKLSRGSILRLVLLLTVIAILVGLMVTRGIHERVDAAGDVQKETVQLAIPAVAVVHPKVGDASNEIVLTGALRPFNEAPIYARASGYVKQWYVNLGDAVKSGQMLAETSRNIRVVSCSIGSHHRHLNQVGNQTDRQRHMANRLDPWTRGRVGVATSCIELLAEW